MTGAKHVTNVTKIIAVALVTFDSLLNALLFDSDGVSGFFDCFSILFTSLKILTYIVIVPTKKTKAVGPTIALKTWLLFVVTRTVAKQIDNTQEVRLRNTTIRPVNFS